MTRTSPPSALADQLWKSLAELTLNELAGVDLKVLRKDFLPEEVFGTTLNAIKHNRIGEYRVGPIPEQGFILTLESERWGFRAELRHRDLDSPLEGRCSCSLFADSALGKTHCYHLASALLLLWLCCQSDLLDLPRYPLPLPPVLKRGVRQLAQDLAKAIPETGLFGKHGRSQVAPTCRLDSLIFRPTPELFHPLDGRDDPLLGAETLPIRPAPENPGGQDLHYEGYRATGEIPLPFVRPPGHILNTAQKSHRSGGLSAEVTQAWRGLVFYWFSDGTLLDCLEILHHPYIQYTPRELLPLKPRRSSSSASARNLLISPKLDWGPSGHGRSFENSGDFDQAAEAILGVLMRASDWANDSRSAFPLNLYLTPEAPQGETFRVLPVREFTAQTRTESTFVRNPPGPPGRSTPASGLRLDLHIPDGCRVFRSFSLTSVEGRFTVEFHPYWRWINTIHAIHRGCRHWSSSFRRPDTENTFSYYLDWPPGHEQPRLSTVIPIADPEQLKRVIQIAIRGMAGMRMKAAVRGLEEPVIEVMNAKDLRIELQLLDSGSRQDWFELHPKLFFKNFRVDLRSIRQEGEGFFLEFQGKTYQIPNESLPSLKSLTALWEKLQGAGGPSPDKEPEVFPVPKHLILELLSWRARGQEIEGGPNWRRICQFYDSLEHPRPPVTTPPSVRAQLAPYQLQGVQWLLDLYRIGFGGILADDMGLGKTLQTLTFLELLRQSGELGKVLIVLPTTLIHNWWSEAQKFTPELPVEFFRNWAHREGFQGLVLCSYGVFAKEHVRLGEHSWNIIVFDEAQNLKNITSQRATAARKVPARHKFCLSGTPLENHYGELYSLIDLVLPGALGDRNTFRSEHEVRDGKIQPEKLEALRLRIKPLILRRTKAQVLTELPTRNETTVLLPFEKKQGKIYRNIALSYHEEVKKRISEKGESSSQLLMFTALLRLRQVCSDPSGVPGVQYPELPPKIKVLTDALREITESGESALVFTQFLATYDTVRATLEKAGLKVFSMNGKTLPRRRKDELDAFSQCPAGAVMLMTLKTGGVGLNLVKASYVFHLEPWWNPAVENQATDRSHRIGQTRPVQVYRYSILESIEEKIEVLKKRKQGYFDSLFSVSSAPEDASGLMGDAAPGRLRHVDFQELLGAGHSEVAPACTAEGASVQ